VPDDSLSIAVVCNQQFSPVNDIWVDLYFTYVEVVTGIENVSDDPALKVFPNPARNKVTFNFKLDRGSHITLSVFNQLGQQIDLLLDENRSGGKHVIDWHPGSLPGGIYTYSLKIGGDIKTGKIILTR
jgi:hypothetical protein